MHFFSECWSGTSHGYRNLSHEERQRFYALAREIPLNQSIVTQIIHTLRASTPPWRRWPGRARRVVCYPSGPYREESNLDRPQQLHLFDPKPYEIKTSRTPKQTFLLTDNRTFYQPPSDVVIYDIHPSGRVVLLSQHPTRIPGIDTRVSFARHRRGMSPGYEARLLARYIYRKAEEGKVSYRHFDEIEV